MNQEDLYRIVQNVGMSTIETSSTLIEAPTRKLDEKLSQPQVHNFAFSFSAQTTHVEYIDKGRNKTAQYNICTTY